MLARISEWGTKSIPHYTIAHSSTKFSIIHIYTAKQLVDILVKFKDGILFCKRFALLQIYHCIILYELYLDPNTVHHP